MVAKKKSVKGNSVKKSVGLFDHIKHVNQVQNPNYFETLEKSDRSTWNNWMVLRALSYNPDYLEIVNELQKYLSLKPEIMYKLLIDIFPKNFGFYPFIKGRNENKFNDDLVSLIAKHFETSTSEAIDHLIIFMSTEDNKQELIKIIKLYGYEEKEIKKLLK